MQKRGKSFLITGGLGFLGQHLVAKLRERYPHAKIKILARRKREFFLSDFEKQPEIDIVYDTLLTDIDTLSPHFRGIDTVFHVAAAVSFWRKDKDLLFDVNVKGTENIIRLCQENSVQNLIHVSSTAALGYNNDKDYPADENLNFDWSKVPKSYYMLSKHQAEESVKKAITKGLPGIIANPSTFFGPGDTKIFSLIEKLENKKIPAIMPGGFAAIDVRDLSDALILLSEKGKVGEQYLLTGGNYTYREVFYTISDLVGVAPPKKIMPFKTVEVLSRVISVLEAFSFKQPQLTYEVFAPGSKFRYYSTKKAEEAVGFKPQYSLKQTMSDVIQYYKSEKGDG